MKLTKRQLFSLIESIMLQENVTAEDLKKQISAAQKELDGIYNRTNGNPQGSNLAKYNKINDKKSKLEKQLKELQSEKTTTTSNNDAETKKTTPKIKPKRKPNVDVANIKKLLGSTERGWKKGGDTNKKWKEWLNKSNSAIINDANKNDKNAQKLKNILSTLSSSWARGSKELRSYKPEYKKYTANAKGMLAFIKYINAKAAGAKK